GNLSFGVDEDTMWSFFNECSSSLKSMQIPTDWDMGRSRGFGYVKFEDIEGAKKACEVVTRQEIEGHAIRLDYLQPWDMSGSGGGGFD
ncbi:RNP-1 like RNA-binding protein, partial [Mycena maculata]